MAFAPVLRALGNDLGFVSLIVYGCGALYVLGLLLTVARGGNVLAGENIEQRRLPGSFETLPLVGNPQVDDTNDDDDDGEYDRECEQCDNRADQPREHSVARRQRLNRLQESREPRHAVCNSRLTRASSSVGENGFTM